MKADFSITNETEYCRSTMAMTTMDAANSTQYVFTTVVEITKNDQTGYQTKCAAFGINKQQAELLVAYLKLTFGL